MPISQKLILNLIALAGLALIWLPPVLPLVDLPQHAQQIAALTALWKGQAVAQAGELTVNWLSPYALFYAAGGALHMALPLGVTLKLLLGSSYLLFVYAGQRMLQHYGAPPAGLIVFCVAFFGLCWLAGFANYLAGAGFLLLLLTIFDKHSQNPKTGTAAPVAALALLLTTLHALLFHFALVVMAVQLAATYKTKLASYVKPALPLVPAAALALLQLMQLTGGQAPSWRFQLPELPLYQSSTQSPAALLLVLALMASFFVLGRWRKTFSRAPLPLLGLLLAALLMPDKAGYVVMITDRLSLFLLPFWALLFTARDHNRWQNAVACSLLLLAGSGLLLQEHTRIQHFERDNTPLMQTLATLPDGQRQLLLLAVDNPNTTTEAPLRFLPLWVALAKNSWAEFSFAALPTAMVRSVQPAVTNDGQMRLSAFNWQAYNASRYNSIIVRHTTPLPPDLFRQAPCTVRLEKHLNGWSVFSVKTCESDTAVLPPNKL